MTIEEYDELRQHVTQEYRCEGWFYFTSYSNIISEGGVGREEGGFVYNPGHGNPQLVTATAYDIKCRGQVAIPAGKTGIVTLASYVMGRPNSRWSIELLSEQVV